MTDQCKHCIFRGDLKACQAAECHKHDDWYSVQLNKRIAELEKERDALVVRVTNCEQVFSDAPDLEFSRFKEMFPDEFEAHNLEEREESVANFCCWLIDNGEPIPEEQLQKYGSDYIECARRQASKLKEGE